MKLISTACDLQGNCGDHDKKKTTFTMLRTVCKEGLHLLSFFFTVFGASMSFSFLYDNVFLFIGVFFSYSEINECVRGLHKCSSDAFCNNTKGSYNCTCKHGFAGNGRECRGRHWIQSNYVMKNEAYICKLSTKES